MFVLNLSTNAWSQLPQQSLQQPRKSAGSAQANGLWYVAGGAGLDNTRLSSVEVFNACDGGWQPLGSPMCTAGSGSAMVSVGDVLVSSGGFDGKSVFDNVQIRTDESEWSEGPALSTARFAHCSVAAGETVWVLGGTNGADCLRSVEMLQLSKKEEGWMPGPSMQNKRFGAAAAVLGQYLYVMGGFDGTTSPEGTQEMLKTTERLDLSVPVEERVWKEGPPLMVGRASSAVTVAAGAIYLIGGYDGKHRLSSVERLHSDSDTRWKECAPMPVCLGSAVACTIVDGVLQDSFLKSTRASQTQ
eukprot:TRINITY_DN52427_c0_g1_i1.p1 TRINITY_DN52427_c0_g1~~TRINITY_DN52427_c0_g1_i1.p1  ORF type:complete len:301 (-),score=78.57 TRINITY_DN52427_c0_g1_i1:137-1039(-)